MSLLQQTEEPLLSEHAEGGSASSCKQLMLCKIEEIVENHEVKGVEMYSS